MTNSNEAYINHMPKIKTHKDLILNVLKSYPDITRFSVGRLTRLGHLEAQRRLSDLKNDGKIYESGSRKHGNNRVSTYSLTTQGILFDTKRYNLRQWLNGKYPHILFEFDALNNHKL